jgi:hypothetical protein
VVEIGAAGSAFFSLVTVAATSAGQTSFAIPGGYTPGAIVVFLNGSSLAPAHYTATNGTAVVLGSGTGVVVGSELVVLRLSAFQVADALPLSATAADSLKLGGVDAGEFYRRSDILGTVSQSGGVPTGAIIERGSNANGEYVRFADGTQICTSPDLPVDATTAAGSIYRGEVGWTFPAGFIDVPDFADCAAINGSYTWGNSSKTDRTSTQTKLRVCSPVSYLAVNASGIAIGRWY